MLVEDDTVAVGLVVFQSGYKKITEKMPQWIKKKNPPFVDQTNQESFNKETHVNSLSASVNWRFSFMYN